MSKRTSIHARLIAFLLLLGAAASLTSTSAIAALSTAATANVDTARQDELLNMEFTVANTDAFARTGVVLTMAYPAGLNQLFESEFDGDCPSTSCSTGETVTWILGTLPAGAVTTVDLPATVSAGVADHTLIAFNVSATDDSLETDAASAGVLVDGTADYDLALAEDSDPVIDGAVLTYKLTFGYRDDAAAASNTQLLFTLPADVSFVSASDGGAVNGGNVEWVLGVLNPGDGGIREVTVQVDEELSLGSIIEATAEVLAVSSPSMRIGAEAATAVDDAASLTLGIEINPNPARADEQTQMQLTVTNNDPFTRFGVELEARYPQTLIQLSESGFDGNCSSTTCSAGERVNWSLGNILAGGSVTVDLPPVVVGTAVDGTLINLFGTVRDDSGAQARQLDTIIVDSNSFFDLSLAENSDPAAAGQDLSYKLSYGYRGDAATSANSRLEFTVPAGTSFVSASGGGTLNGDVVEWILGLMSPGDGGVHEVAVQVDGNLAAGEIIEAYADIFSIDFPDSGMRAEADTVVAANVPLGLFIETNPGSARLDELTNYQLTVTNNGPFTRFGVELEARYPQSLNQLFESVFDGDCTGTACEAGERVNWLLGDISAGATVTVDLPPVVASTAVDGTLINLFATANDDQGQQARQLDTMRVQSDTVYDLSLAENADPAVAGSLVNYQMRYGYRADAGVVTDSKLRFDVPEGTSFVSASNGGVLNSDAVEWALGLLSPGDGGLRTVSVLADAGLAPGSVLEASAEVFQSSDAVESARAEADTVIVASIPLSLDIWPNRNNVLAGTPLSLLLNVTNNDPFTRFGVELEARFPQSLNQLFETAFDGDCPSTACEAGERVNWLLGGIPAGATVTVELPPTVSSSMIDGVLINFWAAARDGQNAQARDIRSLLVGTLDPIDADDDGMSDDFENANSLDPLDPDDADEDLDGDGLTNLQEFDISPDMNPNSPDTDGDGLQDNLDDTPTMANSLCAGHIANLDAIVITDAQQCAAAISVTITGVTSVTGTGNLEVYSPLTIIEELSVNGQISVNTGDPCPACP